jgi:hypothetical protein
MEYPNQAEPPDAYFEIAGQSREEWLANTTPRTDR